MNKIKGIKQFLLFIACLLPSALIMTSCASAEAASADYVYECKVTPQTEVVEYLFHGGEVK